MTEFLQNVTFLHVVALVLVIVYMFTILFGKQSLKPWLKYLFGLGLACFVGWSIMFFVHRNQIRSSLQEMVSVANYNRGIDEKLAKGEYPDLIIKELEKQRDAISTLANESSTYDKVLGRSDTLDALLGELKKKIEAQIFRVSNMSARSKEEYSVESFEVSRDEMNLIKPVFSGNSYVNVGVVIDEEATFKKENSLLVRIVRTDTDSLLFQQSYVPKSGANSFVLPNYFCDDMVQLQIGYVNKNERKTYHYISCIPYGRE